MDLTRRRAGHVEGLTDEVFQVDMDERSVQLAALSLYLKAKEHAPRFKPRKVNLVAANSPTPPDALCQYLATYPEDYVSLR